ncbi:ribokinase [Bifidobacterium sp. ESL0784]|uniref:ribokinase n=1 Tax=Bifidobacterium sp. ESL0784 TaxID=2983231 RepID=UPI0023F868E0|nr:ribokinase [Bifidobacterium sp. ESL0784]MDF7640513.1 ribokinase [Bifidobacterium sp. ESL0784]
MKILNFGSLNIDFVYDVVDFVTKGQTITSSGLNQYPGGKGLNQSIAAGKAGAAIRHAGMIGEDGVFLRDLLDQAGVDTSEVEVSKKERTGNAIIQRNHDGDNCIVLYSGANRAFTKDFVDEVLSKFDKGDWLLVQNETNLLGYIVEQAHRRGMKVAMNPSPADELLDEVDLSLVDCFILNGGEAEAITGESGTPEILLDAMCEKFPNAATILTSGSWGSGYAKGTQRVRQRAYRVPVVDTTAAGDTFTGYVLANMVAGEDIATSLDRASRAAAIAVSRKGAAPSIPLADEVDNFQSSPIISTEE